MPTSAADPLMWRLGARVRDRDYRVFTTAFVDGEHPLAGKKRFSIIEAVDWVNVIALTPAREVVLIRQFRPGVDAICLEIPGGMVDPGEAPAAAAARELAEETGYTSARWQLLGTVSPNPAIMTNRLHMFLAEDCAPGPQQLEGSEVIAVETRTLADCRAALLTGRIDHALVVAAFGQLAFRTWSP